MVLLIPTAIQSYYTGTKKCYIAKIMLYTMLYNLQNCYTWHPSKGSGSRRACITSYMAFCMLYNLSYKHTLSHNLLGLRLAAALLPQLFGKNPRSHHKGATCRVRTGDQLLPVICHCQLGQDIPLCIICYNWLIIFYKTC